MKAEKDKKTGKWLIQYRYTDWQGKRRKSTKRGFATKREAEEWLRNFLITQKADFDMKFENFWKMYYAKLYNDAWNIADNYAVNHLQGDELNYFYNVTD